MANVKISDLPAATGLNTTDIVPIVQAGVTKRTTAGAITDTMTGFIQSSTGAGSSRSVQTELREVFFNVKSGPFGATGDGSTDDTTAIQNALNAVPSGGAIVYVPPTTASYKVSSPLLVKSGTRFCGAGVASVIQWAGGNVNVIQNKTYDHTSIGVNTGTADTDIEIDHLKVICTGTTSGSSNRGIAFGNVVRGSIHENYVTNPGNAGIMVAPGRDIKVYGNTVTGGNATSANNGISVDNSSNRVTVSNNICTSIYDSGIGIHNSSVDCVVAGNVVDTTTIGYGIDLAGCQKTTVTGNTTRSTASDGIFVHDQTALDAGYVCSEITVTGNEIYTAGNHGIDVADASTGKTFNVSVTGNLVKSPTASGIVLNKGVKGVTVTGNTVDGGVVGLYLTQNVNAPSFCTVVGNTVSNATTGMTLDSLVASCTIGPNTFNNCGTDSSLSATQYSTNTIVGNGGNYGVIKIRQPAGTANFGIDASNTGQTVADSTTITPFAASNNFSGMFVVEECTLTGEAAIFLAAGGVMKLVSQSGTKFTVTSGTGTSVNVYLSGSVVTIENKLGSSAEIRVLPFRLRSSQ